MIVCFAVGIMLFVGFALCCFFGDVLIVLIVYEFGLYFICCYCACALNFVGYLLFRVALLFCLGVLLFVWVVPGYSFVKCICWFAVRLLVFGLICIGRLNCLSDSCLAYLRFLMISCWSVLNLVCCIFDIITLCELVVSVWLIL